MRIRQYQPSDWSEWVRMSRALFPGVSAEEDEAEMRATLARPDQAHQRSGYVEVDRVVMYRKDLHSSPRPKGE